MSEFFDEILADVRELLDEVGEPVVIKRQATLDKATRRLAAGPGAEQTVMGTFESGVGKQFEDSLTRKFEKVLVAAPALTDPFDPKVEDRVEHEGSTWRAAEVAIERRQGVTLLLIIGLETA